MKILCPPTKILAATLLGSALVACGGSTVGTPNDTATGADITSADSGATDTSATDSTTTESANDSASDSGTTDSASDSGDTSLATQADSEIDSQTETDSTVADITSPREIEGTWTTGCFPFQGGGDSQSRILTYVIEGNASVFTSLSYSDTNCSVPVTPIDGVIATESSNTDSLEFPDQTVTTELGEASFINFTTVSFTNDGVTVPGSGTIFTLFLISDDQLFFGIPAGTTAETRPTELDPFFFFTRS